MPLFDFTCRSCGHTFEALVRAGSTPACPHCGAADLERHLPSVAVKTAERSRASADANIRKHSILGHKETMLREEEAQKHRHDDH
jgi:putative FmdB family regulatory protein